LRWALPLFVLGAALRFWFAATAGELRPDERDRYLPIARSLREGEGFAIAGKPTAQSMPLWPAVLSLLPAGEQGRWLAALFSTLALPVAWAVGRKLAEPKVALLALALLAVDLDQAVLGGSLLAEPLFTLLLCLFALAWVHGRVAWAALALAAAVLTRPEAALIPFALAVSCREWRRPLVLLAACVIAVASWARRNERVFGEFVPLTSTAGLAFHSGMNPGDLELPFRKRGQARSADVKEYKHARDLAGQGIEVTYSREKMDEALSFARQQPVAAAGIVASKFLQLWTPLQRKGTSAVYALATLLAWWALWCRVRYRPALLGPMLVVMTIVGMAFLSIPRYRAPYDPYMFLLAASAPWRRR